METKENILKTGSITRSKTPSKPGKTPVKNLVKTGRGYISYLNDPVIYPVVNRVNDPVF